MAERNNVVVQGIESALLTDVQKLAALAEDYYNERQDLRQQLNTLRRENETLQQEIASLREELRRKNHDV